MDSGFYVIDESAPDYPTEATSPLQFDVALAQAQALIRTGHRVRVLYSDGASQAQITRFADEGILAELASTA